MPIARLSRHCRRLAHTVARGNSVTRFGDVIRTEGKGVIDMCIHRSGG
jgi:hypothetical protein